MAYSVNSKGRTLIRGKSIDEIKSRVLIICILHPQFCVRDEIAACAEKAYLCISFPEATRVLYFDSEKDMKSFATRRGWTLQQDHFFYFDSDADKETKQEIPSYKMIQHMLEYAKELERIV